MNLNIDFWQLVGMLAGMLATVIGSVISLGRWLASEYDRRQEMRFAEFKAAVEASDRSGIEMLRNHISDEKKELARIASHAERIARLEESLRCAPSHADLKSVQVRLDSIASKTDTMQGQLPGLIDNVRLILTILKKD